MSNNNIFDSINKKQAASQSRTLQDTKILKPQ